MTFKEILLRSFTWWNGQTWGTYIYTRRKGEFVGTDELGNRYYTALGPMIDVSNGPQRRWVIYNGEADASTVPPSWRSWLTHTHDILPSEQKYVPREWEKPHLANMTGSAQAYRPPGSTLARGERQAATGDYLAWSPDGWSPTGREEDGKAGPDGDVPQAIQHPGTHGHELDLQKHSG